MMRTGGFGKKQNRRAAVLVRAIESSGLEIGASSVHERDRNARITLAIKRFRYRDFSIVQFEIALGPAEHAVHTRTNVEKHEFGRLVATRPFTDGFGDRHPLLSFLGRAQPCTA
jgi:hypothetical protein